jgi:hypothetical protein
VYELGRRMQCDEWLKAVLEKLGKDDGSTKESVREAFALFVSTPFITGDDFKVEDGQKMNAPSETIKIETIREKACVKFSKHGKCGHHEHKEHHEAPTYHDCHNNHNSHSG